jgi:pimeloyl-ACP methyl ester carboxylesterase
VTTEACPPPLSTVDVFESFERDGTAWELETPQGTLHGWTMGQGPAIYFVNGLEGTSELFRLLAWLLREEFRCVMFDPVAPSPRAARSLTDVAQVSEVQQLFADADGHGDERFVAYGSGFGGWTALAAMLANPSRFRGAVLQAAYALRQFKLFERFLLFLGKRSKRQCEDVPGWRGIFEQNHRLWFPPFDKARWELFYHLAGRVEVSDIVRRASVMRKVKLLSRLSEIKVPVLSLKSEGQGRMRIDLQQHMETSLPTCRAEYLKDSGMIPHWTHPHRVAKLVREFMATLGGS